jgi:hypothetical protein
VKNVNLTGQKGDKETGVAADSHNPIIGITEGVFKRENMVISTLKSASMVTRHWKFRDPIGEKSWTLLFDFTPCCQN